MHEYNYKQLKILQTIENKSQRQSWSVYEYIWCHFTKRHSSWWGDLRCYPVKTWQWRIIFSCFLNSGILTCDDVWSQWWQWHWCHSQCQRWYVSDYTFQILSILKFWNIHYIAGFPECSKDVNGSSQNYVPSSLRILFYVITSPQRTA